MIKSETVRLKVSSSTKQNYSNLGYDLTQKEIDIKVSDLKVSSAQRIEAICDVCGDICNIQYSKYNRNVKNNGIFSCKNCYTKKCYDRFTNNNPSLKKDFLDKRKETWIKKYGVDHPSKSKEIQNKISETNMKKYGVSCIFELVDLIKSGMIEKHNVESPLKSKIIKDKMVNTLIKKYGVSNISKIDIVKDKKVKTCLIRYGVEHHMQQKDIFDRFFKSIFRLNRYNETEIYYQSSYELDFLNYCNEIGIIDFVSKGPSIKYILESNERIYHSDFFIEKINLIVEIKSDYTYMTDLDKNKMKEEYCLKEGYDFLFIINKDYSEFIKFVEKTNM